MWCLESLFTSSTQPAHFARSMSPPHSPVGIQEVLLVIFNWLTCLPQITSISFPLSILISSPNPYLISSTHLPITWLSLYKVLLFPSCFFFFLSPHPTTHEFHELDVKDIITFCPTPEALRNYQFHRAPTEAWGLWWSWQYNWNTFCILRTLSPHIRSSLFSPLQPENLSGGESDHNLIGSHSLSGSSLSCSLYAMTLEYISHHSPLCSLWLQPLWPSFRSLKPNGPPLLFSLSPKPFDLPLPSVDTYSLDLCPNFLP